MISVLIPTRNRPDQIGECVKSLLNSTYSDYEIIVIDQSNNNTTKRVFLKFKSKRIRYLKVKLSNKSNALNLAINQTKGDVIAFTDDDCIVDKLWLDTINHTFQNQLKISAAFGKTLPFKPNNHLNKVCPSTFTKDGPTMISKPKIHYKHIGFGNNMAFKKDILLSSEGFKKWLGPGSSVHAAEDAEMALRLLIRNYKIYYNPKIIVYHNKWLSKTENLCQKLSYTCGEMACYGYFYFQGYKFANPVISDNLKDSYYKIIQIIKKIIFLKWSKELVYNTKQTILEILYRIRGLFVGLFYSVFDPIKSNP